MTSDSADQHSGPAGGRDRAAVRTAGLWRLADLHGPDHRLYGEGERCFHPDHPVRLLGSLCSCPYPGPGGRQLLVFCLLYTPCIAAVASVKRELGGKWAAIMVVNQCVTAWLCALVMRLILLAI